MAAKPKCDNCEKTGLAILPVRYTVLPKDVKAQMPGGLSGERVTGVGLTDHHYGVRTLREGWIYLFYEVGARGSQYWEVYKVTADGRLWKHDLASPASPTLSGETRTDPACAQCAIAVPMDIIAIEQPKKCTGKVYIAFSEHAWHAEVFNHYKTDAKLRTARMQYIEPSKWIKGGADAHGHAIAATESAIDAVLEYMPAFDPKQFSLPDDKQPFSTDKGDYKDDWLKLKVTRYPLFIRQASPLSTSQALVKLMQQVGTDASGSSHPPMLLALWDSIGNVHELNGFRSDPVSWLDRYVATERTLQVGAQHDVDAAKAIVQSRNEERVKGQDTVMNPLASPDAPAMLAKQRAQALAGADPARAAQINAFYDDQAWMAANNTPPSYQRRLNVIGISSSATNPNSSAPYTGAYRDEVMSEARAYAQKKGGQHARDLQSQIDSSTAYEWSKYAARLRAKDLDHFRDQYQKLRTSVHDLQETRSADVGAWLQAQLLFDTLEDYGSTDLNDAAAFEIVVTDATAGLGSTPTGKKILDTLVAQWNPVELPSLIWRVFAMNQMDARQELAEYLKTAQAKKDTPLAAPAGQAAGGHSPGVDAVISASGTLAKLNGYYSKLASLATQSDPAKITPAGNALKRLHADTFVMSVGDAIYRKFRINQMGDFVGEKLIQTLLLTRAGVSNTDAIALVRKQADLELMSREEKLSRVRAAVPFLRAGASAKTPPATKDLYDTWHQMAQTEDGVKSLRAARIGVVAMLLESVNFYKLMTGAKDDDTNKKLVQSGVSLLSSMITITMTPYYAALKNSNRTRAWKFVGGGLGAIGAAISVWMDSAKAIDAGSKRQFDATIIYTIKTLTDFGITGAIVIDTISTSAPLLKTIARRYGTEAVIAAVEAITERAAAWAVLRGIGMLLGWEAAIGLIVLQAAADWLTPTALETWCSECAFGTGRTSFFRAKDYSVKLYTDPAEQEKDYVSAMTQSI
ncbi:T6SS effector BTH_I2691 family protein [Paraburkholderia nodosa]|uniref:T6SS effector BTH_I2691 family protein n=1 Tax=Paraburkholderia nodosa TaxID=392320 RepID=UPI0008419906|nr:T6SS effector BTH_I2691 family protein [Paraburkholderia nodosa]